MDDQLDKDLSKRIQEVFENYEDASANEGWLKLREKFPEERKRRGLVWLWPAAALLLLFLGLGLMKVFNGQKPENHLAGSKPVKQNPAIQNSQKDTMMTQHPVTAGTQSIAQPANTTRQQLSPGGVTGTTVKRKPVADTNRIAKNQSAQPGIKTNTAIASATVAKPINTVAANTAAPVKQPHPQANANAATQNVILPGVVLNQTSPLLAQVDTAKKKAIKNDQSQQVAVNTSAKDTSAKAVAAVKKPSNIDELFASDQGKTPLQIDAKTDKRVKFGVFAATYISYAKNGNNQVNAGGGFTAAIPLNQNLRLVTGASVNQNSFSYNNSGGFNGVSAAVPASYYSVNNNAKFSNVTAADYAQGASLLGIDIPLNLQYQFNTTKNQVYILGGFSSGTFINESYNYLYSNGSTLPLQSYKGFNDFYFVRTLNLGFGVGYPVGKSQIVIEPFLKYPLTGMGAEQLKFGASGINLKFNFTTKK